MSQATSQIDSREGHTTAQRHCRQASRSSHLPQRTQRYQRPHGLGLLGRLPLDLFRKVCMHLPRLSLFSTSNSMVANNLCGRPRYSIFLCELRALSVLRLRCLRSRGLCLLPKLRQPKERQLHYDICPMKVWGTLQVMVWVSKDVSVQDVSVQDV